LDAGSDPLFFWIFGGFGFAFVLIAVSFDDLIPRTWIDAGKATIINVEATNFSSGGSKVYAYHFEATDNGDEKIGSKIGGKIIGVSYEYEEKYKIGDEAPLLKAGNQYRIQGLALEKNGAGGAMGTFGSLGVGFLFGCIGLFFPIYIWLAAGKTIRLLRDGVATDARYVGMEQIPGSQEDEELGMYEMKVNFEYEVDGKMHTKFVKVSNTDTSRLTDGKYKVVLYDPMKPEQSVVLDGLPCGIHFDESTREFRTNPLRCVLPLLAATIVCGEIIAIIVLVIKAIL
jgi:hypothetical protein